MRKNVRQALETLVQVVGAVPTSMRTPDVMRVRFRSPVCLVAVRCCSVQFGRLLPSPVVWSFTPVSRCGHLCMPWNVDWMHACARMCGRRSRRWFRLWALYQFVRALLMSCACVSPLPLCLLPDTVSFCLPMCLSAFHFLCFQTDVCV